MGSIIIQSKISSDEQYPLVLIGEFPLAEMPEMEKYLRSKLDYRYKLHVVTGDKFKKSLARGGVEILKPKIKDEL